MEFVGHNGQIELLEDKIIISRKGALAFLTNGIKGSKTIPFSSVTTVQFKEASIWTNGYIRFSVQGGIESRGGLFDAASDENSVMFRSGEQSARFTELKKQIEERILKARPIGNNPMSAADELEKFAAPRERGIITDEEFQQKKKSLLGI